MKKIKIILGYVLGLILSISLFILVISIICYKTVLDKSFMDRLIDENNYYENIYNEIDLNVKDYITSSGFDNSILEGIIVKEEVYNDISVYFDLMYKGKFYEVDSSKVETRLKDNINKYLVKHNLGVNDTQELDMFIKDIGDIYKNEINMYGTLRGFVNRVTTITNIVRKVIIIDGVIVGVSLIIVSLLRTINIGSCIMSSGLMVILFRLFIYERIDVENILIISEYFSNILKSIFNYISNYMLEISVILIGVGFLFSLFKIKDKKVEK